MNTLLRTGLIAGAIASAAEVATTTTEAVPTPAHSRPLGRLSYQAIDTSKEKVDTLMFFPGDDSEQAKFDFVSDKTGIPVSQQE